MRGQDTRQEAGLKCEGRVPGRSQLTGRAVPGRCLVRGQVTRQVSGEGAGYQAGLW